MKITTGQLVVQDGAEVSVSSQGSGNAGNLEVGSRSIRLDNQARLRSDTQAGEGNIILDSQDLVLRRGSRITANAEGTAAGGNITIGTGVIAALENSDITANAVNARGGQINIDAQGIFGTEFREERTLESDITATSERGPEFSGTVEIITPDADLSSGLVNLPSVPVATEVVQACQPGGNQQQSEFVITGRGGLPSNPGEALSTDAVQVDLMSLNSEVERSASTAVSMNPTRSTPARLVEAQGWVIDANGNVVLTTNASSVSPRASWQKTSDCQRNES